MIHPTHPSPLQCVALPSCTSYSYGRLSSECFLLTNSTTSVPDWGYNSGVFWAAAPPGTVAGTPPSTALWVGGSVAPSATPSPPAPGCAALFRSLPRTDLVGTLTGNAWYPGTSLPSPSESACRQSCCDSPVCDAYTFASTDLQFAMRQGLSPEAECFLFTNVTALVPSNTMSSGALLSAYS